MSHLMKRTSIISGDGRGRTLKKEKVMHYIYTVCMCAHTPQLTAHNVFYDLYQLRVFFILNMEYDPGTSL